MRLKALLILLLIVASLLPFYSLYKYLQRTMRPRESGRRFFSWLLLTLLLVFAYSFLIVFLIRLLIPPA